MNDKVLKIIGIILNVIWIILFLPACAISLMAGVATIMMTDSGAANFLQTAIIIICMLMFFVIPVVIIISVVCSFIFRKYKKFLFSIIIQFAPLVIALFAYIFLFYNPLM